MSQSIVDCAQFSYNFIACVYFFFFIPLPLSMVSLLLLLSFFPPSLLSLCILFPMARNFSIPIFSRVHIYYHVHRSISFSPARSFNRSFSSGSVIFFIISFNFFQHYLHNLMRYIRLCK